MIMQMNVSYIPIVEGGIYIEGLLFCSWQKFYFFFAT